MSVHKHYQVKRIAQGRAVLSDEDGQILHIDIEQLPDGARLGDRILLGLSNYELGQHDFSDLNIVDSQLENSSHPIAETVETDRPNSPNSSHKPSRAKINFAYLYIIIAATFWGLIGIFVKGLGTFGFSSIEIVTLRTTTAAFFLLIYLASWNPAFLKIKVSDSWYFVGTGVISIVLFNWAMFQAIEETTIAISAILLYTAPVIVALLARLFFGEVLTRNKILALFLTVVGAAFVVGLLPNNMTTISTYGLFLGLGSGFFYALYSIFSKFALRKYSSLTITCYTFVFATLAVLPFNFRGLIGKSQAFLEPQVWFYILGLSLISTVAAYLLYTQGLKYVEASRAAIIATIEPVVATLVSLFIFSEILQAWQMLGIIMVLSAIVLVQGGKDKV